MSDVQPFKISVPEEKLTLLQQKLSLVTLPDDVQSPSWSQGVPLPTIKRLINHWKKNYSWRTHEEDINATFSQFITPIEVDGFGELNIHFVHVKSGVEGAVPLCFVHGWPG